METFKRLSTLLLLRTLGKCMKVQSFHVRLGLEA